MPDEQPKEQPKETYIALGHNRRILVASKEWKGKTFLDIRKQYQDDADEWKFTPKGITVGVEEVRETIQAMIEVADSMGIPELEEA